MQLSSHFSLAEMTASGKHKNIPNTPSQPQIIALEALCDHVLEPVRQHFGKPVIVNSGFRSVELNKAVGGAASSQHLKGEAADIEIPGVRNDDIWLFIEKNLAFDQLIAEQLSEFNGSAGWVHVSFSLYQTRKDAKSFLGHGKYVKGLKYAS